MKELTRVV